MIKVLTFGVFDLLHYGHVNLFRRAKYNGDFLIVAVQDDLNSVKNKPNIHLVNNLKKRMDDVFSIDYVARVISYSQVDVDIKTIDFDVLIVGEDQTNEHFKKAIEWCNKNKKAIIVLERTNGISSTQLRKKN